MLCKRDVSVSHRLRGKGLWEEQLSGGQIRSCSTSIFILCLDVALKVMLLVLRPHPAGLRGAAAGPSCDCHGPWGSYGDSMGQGRPQEALPRLSAGEGAAFGKWLWQAGACESSSDEVFPQERSEHKHSSSLGHERGLVHEGGSGGRVGWGREAGEGLVGWLVEGDHAGSGPGRAWVAVRGAVSSREEGLG